MITCNSWWSGCGSYFIVGLLVGLASGWYCETLVWLSDVGLLVVYGVVCGCWWFLVLLVVLLWACSGR